MISHVAAVPRVPVFVDTNVPMYAGGGEHPLRGPALRVMEAISQRPAAFVCSAEVLQEILHRYLKQGLWARGHVVFEGFSELMLERIEPVLAGDVELAARLADTVAGADARDLLHAAVMQRLGVTRIISTDRGFDGIEGITRLDPALAGSWITTFD